MATASVGKFTGLAGLAAVALMLSGVAPASAEFFGCNKGRSTVSYSSHPLYSAPSRPRQVSRYTHEFAAQRARRHSYSAPAYRRSAYR